MDICMFTPSERAKLEELIVAYDKSRERLMAFLDIIEKEWEKEIKNEPPIYPLSQRLECAMARLDL
jgi:hypothetical protein